MDVANKSPKQLLMFFSFFNFRAYLNIRRIIMIDIKNQYRLYKSANKKEVYKNNYIFWSDDLRRWVCTNPDLIKHILLLPHCLAINHKIKKIEDRFDINLSHVDQLTHYLPVTQNDEFHKELRKKLALIMTKNSSAAIKFFQTEIDKKFNSLFCLEHSKEFDLYLDILKPIINKMAQILAGIKLEHVLEIDMLSTIFDETLSIERRIELNKCIGDIFLILHKESNDEEDDYSRIALLALGKDSLLSTISESLISTLTKNTSKLLSEINWPSEMPASGVPVIERIASLDFEIHNIQIKKDERLRLYLDSAGFTGETCPHYASLYFGAGVHSCLGISVAKKAWSITIDTLKKIDKNITITDLSPRKYDNVFNLYDKIEVIIDDRKK